MKEEEIEDNLDERIEKEQIDAVMRRLVRENTELIKGRAFQDRLIEVVKDSIVALPAVKVMEERVLEKKVPEETVVGLISDLHIGEKVSKEETRGLGGYNFDIFKKRFNFYIDKIIDFSQNKLQGYVFKKCNLVCLGDMVSGTIHEELLEMRDLSILDQAFLGARVIGEGIRRVASIFPSVEVDCVFGAHGRLFTKKRYKERYVNWDEVLFRVLELLLKEQKNVKFVIPRSFFEVIDIEGWKFLIYHGDDIKSWMSLPYYGIERDVARFRDLLYKSGEKFDYVLIGHFHEMAELGQVVVVNGTMKGADEFGMGKLRKAGRASQKIFGVHKKHGKTWSFDIRMDDIK